MSLESTSRSTATFNMSADTADNIRIAIDDLLTDSSIEPLLKKGLVAGYDPSFRLPSYAVAKSPLLAEKCADIVSRTNGAYKSVRVDSYYTPKGGSFHNITFCRAAAPEQKPLTGFLKWWDDFSPSPRPTYIVS